MKILILMILSNLYIVTCSLLFVGFMLIGAYLFVSVLLNIFFGV